MTGQILRSGSDRHLRLINLDTHLAPLSQRVQIGTTLDQTLSQLFSSSLQSVSTDGKWSLCLICFEKLDQLSWVEEIKEVVDELEVVAIVSMQQSTKLFDVVLTGSSLTELGDVHEDIDSLLDLQVDHTDVDGLIVLLLLLGRGITVNLISLFINAILPLISLLFLVLVMIFFMEILPFDISRQFLIIFAPLLSLFSFLSFLVVFLTIEVIINFLLPIQSIFRLFDLVLDLFGLFGSDFFLLLLFLLFLLLLLFELILGGFRLPHLDLLTLIIKGKSGEGILASFSLVDNLKELLAGRWSRLCLADWLCGGRGDLLVFRWFGWLGELFLFVLLAHGRTIVEI